MAAPSSVKMKANRKAISGPPANETAEPVPQTPSAPPIQKKSFPGLLIRTGRSGVVPEARPKTIGIALYGNWKNGRRPTIRQRGGLKLTRRIERAFLEAGECAPGAGAFLNRSR
jgi:hypothetical protein